MIFPIRRVAVYETAPESPIQAEVRVYVEADAEDFEEALFLEEFLTEAFAGDLK